MDFKKMFPDKKISQKKVLDFLDKKGFYIVLVLCITVIGATAALITAHNVRSSKDIGEEDIISPDMASSIINENASNSTYLLPQDGSDAESATETSGEAIEVIKPSSPAASPKAEESPKPSAKPQKAETQSKTEAQGEKVEAVKTAEKSASKSEGKTESNKNVTFAMPVFGEVTFEYAMDRLVYSKTLDEWRAHSGVDLRADRGTPVKVVADGVVTEVKNDPRFGVTIIVEHENGIKTLYANLASGDMVTPNQKVKQGEIIGSVGNTAIIESAEPAHLHFEVLKDNKPVDPKSYLQLPSDDKK
ncbi:M23 family metallopeptidase [Acetivibrio mesophilus]|uniref:M23 family metallopeptidase n=1 Tax=Acetivibrio mesophilus TaxID=2487273 RepID=A0A4Q0I535_9FIRM|nr:M23 family metallopeptidase [Acetivibrio mesophilus]ODM27421.1 peptidase M23 [Clostridium sp. Bc-iso-3]RXE59381.1 M23 family metallopeptidase [Acetivibrio mesophilus]HHV30162.1 M23 family metallopeptidase [Clostridium sp.]